MPFNLQKFNFFNSESLKIIFFLCASFVKNFPLCIVQLGFNFLNFRSHMLDDQTYFANGHKCNVNDFWDLKRKTDSEITTNFRMKDIHLTCKNQDRQSVSFARALLSKSVAVQLRNIFPKSQAKQALADFVEICDSTYDILTSSKIKPKNPSKLPLRINLEKQTETLLKMYEYVDNMRFVKHGPISKKQLAKRALLPCQKGMKIAISCAIKLQATLKSDYGLPYLRGTRITQDHLESFFGSIRKMGGRDVNPTALQFNRYFSS